MNGIEYLSVYQDAVLAALREIPWARTVGAYPEMKADFATPALFFDVSQWARAEREIAGNVTVDLRGMIYIVRHYDEDREDESTEGVTETRVRNAALKMSDWVHGRQFGSCTAPAVFEDAQPMIWQSGDDTRPNHAIWSVAFSQLLGVGPDSFDEPDAPLLKSFWLGIFPEVGLAHKDDYTLIAGAEEN